MLKYVLLASAMTMAAPSIAQQAAPTTQSAPTTGAATPATGATAPVEAQGATTTTAPGDTTAVTNTQTAPAQTAQGDPAPQGNAAQGTNEPDQVAAILDSEFPTYDKDKSGTLSKVEFASWMDTLKTKADPAAKPDKAWNDAAFKKADSDKSASVSKTELAGFLSGGSKQAG